MDDEARFTRYVDALTNEQVLLLQRVASRRASRIYRIRDRQKWEHGVACARPKQVEGYAKFREYAQRARG